jgi:hypothetical protein
METRDRREARLTLARRRLATANDALAAAHDAPLPKDSPAARADFIQRAQEHVITIEQEVALLTNGLERDYPDADISYSAGDASDLT